MMMKLELDLKNEEKADDDIIKFRNYLIVGSPDIF